MKYMQITIKKSDIKVFLDALAIGYWYYGHLKNRKGRNSGKYPGKRLLKSWKKGKRNCQRLFIALSKIGKK